MNYRRPGLLLFLLAFSLTATAAEEESYLEAGSGPKLISPKEDAVMDNGRLDRKDVVAWDFKWEAVPSADEYELEVKGKTARIARVSKKTKETSFSFAERGGYIVTPRNGAWSWRVRAKVGGEWTDWTSRQFSVEPVDTDAPSQP